VSGHFLFAPQVTEQRLKLAVTGIGFGPRQLTSSRV
jgi:hypothetical protein